MRQGQDASQSVRIRWDENEVNVIGQLAVGPNCDSFSGAVLSQKLTIELVVVVAQKGGLPAGAALGDVMWNAREDRTSEAGHARG